MKALRATRSQRHSQAGPRRSSAKADLRNCPPTASGLTTKRRSSASSQQNNNLNMFGGSRNSPSSRTVPPLPASSSGAVPQHNTGSLQFSQSPPVASMGAAHSNPGSAQVTAGVNSAFWDLNDRLNQRSRYTTASPGRSPRARFSYGGSVRPGPAPDASPIKGAAEWNDPSHNAILKSSDGKNFRVPDYLLKTYSGVFRSLMEMPSDGPIEIPMTESASVIAIFLYTLDCPKNEIQMFTRGLHPFPKLEHLNSTDWVQLCCLIDKYEVEKMEQLYYRARDEATNKDPASAFVAACQLQQWDFGAKMILLMQKDLMRNHYLSVGYAYQGKKIRSIEPGRWDEKMMSDAGELATARLIRAWDNAKDQAGREDNAEGFAGLLAKAFHWDGAEPERKKGKHDDEGDISYSSDEDPYGTDDEFDMAPYLKRKRR